PWFAFDASPKLVFLEGDTAQPHLGLKETRFVEVRNLVDVIIHNAWKLDFTVTKVFLRSSLMFVV
ncbi:hypothetical protein BDN72DRAFT_927436, partial [Pluteus cervinus]